MPWNPLPDVPKGLPRGRKIRILVDESCGKAVAEYLVDQGYNAVFASDIGLTGKSDHDLAAYAWRENRVIWTHDRFS
jgi:predicted nuclease of predicted toxin-antitoxin system